MQISIGKFAALCDTKISVLRHYDKEGLLAPAYVDSFTGYRYYAAAQRERFRVILALKSAGFTLPEIRVILSKSENEEALFRMLEEKRAALTKTLERLNEVKKVMKKAKMNDQTVPTVELVEKDGQKVLRTERVDKTEQGSLLLAIEQALSEKYCQRISPIRILAVPKTEDCFACCDVLKLSEERRTVRENLDLPFEDDDVVGKWEFVGEYAVAEDFFAGRDRFAGDRLREVYFLPGGQKYWCYHWTKGKLLFQNGECATANDYTVAEYCGEQYMLVQYKSFEYFHGGRPTVLVLRRLDRKAYTKEEIARRDNVDLPFQSDPDLLGAWRSVATCQTPEAFDPQKGEEGPLFFGRVEFREGGAVSAEFGGRTVEGPHLTWTKGYFLHRGDRTASAYRRQVIDGVEYLFMEWKNGDYVYGGLDPMYYVFRREEG